MNIEIQALKERLSDSDYMILKCQEYALAGLPLPYDIAVLHATRQNLRDEINALEIADLEEENEAET